MSRGFLAYGRVRQALVALGHLYLATYLFLLATGLWRVASAAWVGAEPMAARLLVRDPLLGTVLGLTYTGYVLVLWPLSYLNHRLVAAAR